MCVCVFFLLPTLVLRGCHSTCCLLGINIEKMSSSRSLGRSAAQRHLKIGPNYQRKAQTDRQAAILILVYGVAVVNWTPGIDFWALKSLPACQSTNKVETDWWAKYKEGSAQRHTLYRLRQHMVTHTYTNIQNTHCDTNTLMQVFHKFF